MRKIIITLISFLLVFTCLPAQAFAVSSLDIAAKSAVVYIGDTDEVIWGSDYDKQFNPASITKLMTCLIAIEKLGLDEKVKVCKEATQIKYTVPTLKEGEELTVEELVYMCMLESVNDAAKQLAISISGSEKDFSVLMNERASEIGCKNTVFNNASGVTENGNLSTAKDIVLIAKEALSNPDLRRICETTKYTVKETNLSAERKLHTSNLFIEGGKAKIPDGKVKVEAYPGVFGGKTGTTLDNACTMVVGCNMEGLEIYAAILGSTYTARYKDIKTILDYAKTELNPYTAFKSNDEFGKGKIQYGSVNKVTGVAASDGIINLPEGASASLVTSEPIFDPDLKAPITAGQKIGTIVISLANEPIRRIDMVAQNDIKEGWFLSRFYISNLTTIIIGLVILLFISFVLLVLILRAKNRKKREKLRKEKIREAARKQMEQERDWNERGWTYH